MVALKALLKDMTDEGLVDMAPGRAFHKHGGLPRVTVFRVAAVEGDVVWAVPEHWEASGPPPRVRVMEKGRKGALGVGDRILARTEERGTGHGAYPLKQNGRATCRERMCKSVKIRVVNVSLKTKKTKTNRAK